MDSTITAIRAICGADPTLTPEQINAAVSALSSREKHQSLAVYSPIEVAGILGVKCRTVRNYEKRGLLVPIKTGAKGKRTRAYTASSVEKFING